MNRQDTQDAKLPEPDRELDQVARDMVDAAQARLDMLVADRLVVELKACPSLLPINLAQVLSYLKASNRSLRLLVNFNVASA